VSEASTRPALRARWLGRVTYADALALQTALWAGDQQYLLLCEHTPVYTMGVRTDPANILVDDLTARGADVHRVTRGGDVTWHGPGQVVGYPLVSAPTRRGGGMADTVAYVRSVEQLLIDALGDLGLDAGRRDRYPGVWVGDDATGLRKVAAIGVRMRRGRAMHGFALNVDPDLSWFDAIVPCGIADASVTSLAAEGYTASVRDVVDVITERAAALWGSGAVDRADVVWRHHPDDLSAFSRGAAAPSATAGDADTGSNGSLRLHGRLAQAGVVETMPVRTRKPDWMRRPIASSPGARQVRETLSDLDLVTVCEEAGCPNQSECWSDGTATFMINGERCTRACGFCLVDTRKPQAPDPDEPDRVAGAVQRMGLSFAVVTTVARDDLSDGGAGQFVATIRAIRARTPDVAVEVLISDCQGDEDALGAIYAARPDVLNHNIETVARLQRAARPSASYARSLAVLARAKAADLTTKSGLVVGMGESDAEIRQTLDDLAAVGVDIVTIGQYLRPTRAHLPVATWWEPDAFDRWKRYGEDTAGIGHVESSPLTRSSYHARQAAAAP
jgi:lipoic acid synthetase